MHYNISPIRNLLFVLLILCSVIKISYSQQSIIELSDNGSSNFNIGRDVLFYEDKTGKMDLKDILLLSDKFEKRDQDVPNYGVTKSTIWCMMDVKNNSKNEWMLAAGYPNIDTLTFYYPEDGIYKYKKSGWAFDQSVRDLKAADLVFKLNSAVAPDTVLRYYLKAQARIIILPLTIGKSDTVKEIQHTNALYYLFYLGLISMLFFYNFAIFVTSREKEYFYYSTWVFFVIAFFTISKGYSTLILPVSMNFITIHTNIFSSLGGISILLFVQTTLRLKEYMPALIKWFQLLIAGFIFIIICSLLHKFQLCSNLSQLFLILSVILGLYSGIAMFRKGHTFARFYMYGFIVTLITMFTYILIFQQVLTFNTITGNSILIGSGLEMVLFSFGLGAKIKSINDEKHQAQELAYSVLKEKELLVNHQNVLLETKVIERTAELRAEKKKSDDLLLNILPEEVAEELKRKGSAEAKMFDNVTVLFTDFVNFTGISEKLTPTELVNEIHLCFKTIDGIIESNGLEKIKTIGDAYLAVSGLPNSNEKHAAKTIKAAKEIIAFIKQRKKEGGLFDIRIGINSGAVVAGIVGIKKFAYDIWGDTVNTAARMEQNSESGKINISGSTYELVKNDFTCIYRGKISAKNKGEIDMYFVNDNVGES